MKIYVGNLPYNIKEDQIKQKLEEFGQVVSVSIIMDKMSGKSKGFGFVEMADDAQAKAAINGLAEWEIDGRKIKVNEARPKESGGGGRSFGGGGGFQKRPRRF